MEVQETLSRSYAIPDEIDEADLEASTSVPPYEMLYNAELDAVRMEDEEEGQWISIRLQIPSTKPQPSRTPLSILPIFTLCVMGRLLTSPKPSGPLGTLPPFLPAFNFRAYTINRNHPKLGN